jgi:photosystem II stability/assembly factor-like uncharacterized protein
MKKVFIVISFLLPSIIIDAQWDIIHHVGGADIDFINDSTGVFLTNTSTQDGLSYIAKTTNYGANWDTVFTWPFTHIFHDVAFVSDSVLYVCAEPNLVRKSTNGGESWFDPSAAADPNFSSLFFVNDTIGYGVYRDGLPLCGRTINGGESWEIYNDNCAGRDLTFVDECEGYAPIGNGYYKTGDCGDNWEKIEVDMPNRTATNAWFFNDQTGFLGATGGYGTYFDFNYGSILRTQDGGDNWFILDFPFMPAIFELFFIDEQTGFASTNPFDGHPYSIIKTIDGGDTWGYQDVEFLEEEGYPGIHEIDCPNDSLCYAIGTHIYKTTNGGGELHEAWVEVSSGDLEFVEGSVLEIFPNPTTGISSLKIDGIHVYEENDVSIYDSLGRKLSVDLHKLNDGFTMDMSTLSPGVYFIRLEADDHILTKQLILTK